MGILLTSSIISLESSGLFQKACKLFGGWKNAVEAAGFNYEEIKLLKSWTKEKIIDEFQEIIKINPDISPINIKNINAPLFRAMRRHFGSIRKVYEYLNIEYKYRRKN